MSILSQLTTDQLKRAVALREQIDALQSELSQIGQTTNGTISLAHPMGDGQGEGSGKKLHWTKTAAGKALLRRKARKAWRKRKLAIA